MNRNFMDDILVVDEDLVDINCDGNRQSDNKKGKHSSGGRMAKGEKKSKKNKIATSPRSADCCPCPSAATGWRDGFTHLRVGQAERLACRKRLPNAFCGQKPAPTFLPREAN